MRESLRSFSTRTPRSHTRKTPINRMTIKDQGRVAAVLRHLGWASKRNKTERWWEPGPRALTREE